MATYYISTTGDDINNGTSTDTPWQTLARIASATINAGDSVFFKRGDVWSEESLDIIGQGTSVSKVTYGAYGTGAVPVFSGFRTITSWVNEGGGIYSYQSGDLPTYLRIVVIDGVKRSKGTFPNTGFLEITSNNTTTSLTSTGLTDVINYAGAEVVSFVLPWVIDRKVITTHVGGTLTFPAMQYTNRIGPYFFIQNHISCLNDLGDWMYDTAAKRLYVYFGADPSGFTTKVSITETLINLEPIGGNPTVHKIIRDLKLEGSNGNAYYGFNTSWIKSENLDIRFAGIGAVYFDSVALPTDGNEFLWNTIKDCNAHGLNAGTAARDADIFYNDVEGIGMHIGLSATGEQQSVAILVAGDMAGRNVRIVGNRVKDCGYSGIHFHGSNALVERNFVDGFCRRRTDGGGIYTYDTALTGGGIIRKNISINGGYNGTTGVPFHWGFYFDNRSGGFTIEDNLAFFNEYGGFHFNDPRDMIMKRNLSMNNGFHQFSFNGSQPNSRIPSLLDVQDNIWFTNREELEFDFFGLRFFPPFCMSIDDYTDTGSGYGVMNNNYFLKHSDRLTIIGRQEGPIFGTLSSLATWQTDKSLELNSKTQPSINIANATPVYNDSFSIKSYTFTGSAVDVENVAEPNTFTLEPFAFKLLIGDVTVGEGVVIDNSIRVRKKVLIA